MGTGKGVSNRKLTLLLKGECVSYGIVVPYIGIIGFLATKNQQTIYFVTAGQYWLGTAKPKNVFR